MFILIAQRYSASGARAKRGQVEHEKLLSFEKLMSDWNQTWFMDIKWEPPFVDEVKLSFLELFLCELL